MMFLLYPASMFAGHDFSFPPHPASAKFLRSNALTAANSLYLQPTFAKGHYQQRRRFAAKSSQAGRTLHSVQGPGLKAQRRCRARPWAPEHSTKFTYPTPGPSSTEAALFTPAASFSCDSGRGYWKNGMGTVDPQAVALGTEAGIDMWGTMHDNTMQGADKPGPSCDTCNDDPYGLDLDVQPRLASPEAAQEDMNNHQRCRTAEDLAVYVAQLEQANAKLQETVHGLEQHICSLHANRA